MTDGTVHRRWRILIGVSLLFTAWMTWEGVTGFSLVNNIANTVIPLATVAISIMGWRMAGRAPTRLQRWLCRLACLPGLVSTGVLLLEMLLLALVLALVWPAVVLSIGGGPAPIHFQHAISPDGVWAADVAYQPPLLSTSSHGTLTVTVTYLLAGIPFVSKDIYQADIPETDPVVHPKPYRAYVSWQSNSVLYIASTHTAIPVGLFQRHVLRELGVQYRLVPHSVLVRLHRDATAPSLRQHARRLVSNSS